jgi:uncharacterized membrane protein
MKEKILWIVAAVLSAIAWALHFRYFTSKDFSSTETSLLWAVDTWATLLVKGLFIFPLALIIALFFPKHQSYTVRLIEALPIAIITVEVIMVYSLGSVAYYDLRPDV